MATSSSEGETDTCDRQGEGVRSASTSARGGEPERRARRRSAPVCLPADTIPQERSPALDERGARFFGDDCSTEVEAGEQHTWTGDVLQSILDAAIRAAPPCAPVTGRDGTKRKRATPHASDQRQTPVRSLRRGSPRLCREQVLPIAGADQPPSSSARRSSLRSSAPAGMIACAPGGPEHGAGSQRSGAVGSVRDVGLSGGSKRGGIISPARNEEHLHVISDMSHQHMHNSHKLVLRAFLASDARDKGISDIIGILKLNVGEMPHTAHDSPLHDQVLVLAADKRSEAVSAKAAMRGSRSPSSRTFFIHAVDASNAQSWMLEVVLQIERNAHSALLKNYQEKITALRRELRTRGALVDQHVSEIDAVRALLDSAHSHLEFQRHLRRSAQRVQFAQRKRQNFLGSFHSWRAVALVARGVAYKMQRLERGICLRAVRILHGFMARGKWRRRRIALGCRCRAVLWLRAWRHESWRGRGLRCRARLARNAARRIERALCRAVWTALEDLWQRAVAARRWLCGLEGRARLGLQATWWREWVGSTNYLRRVRRTSIAVASRTTRRQAGCALLRLKEVSQVRRELRWCRMAISEKHRRVLSRFVVRGWVAACAWKSVWRRGLEQTRARELHHVFHHWRALRHRLSFGHRLGCRLQAALVFGFFADHCREQAAVATAKRGLEVRRQSRLFRLWRTAARECQRMAAAVGRQLVRQHLHRVAAEWRSLTDWRRSVRPILGRPGAIDSGMVSFVTNVDYRSSRTRSLGDGGDRSPREEGVGHGLNNRFAGRSCVGAAAAALWRMRGLGTRPAARVRRWQEGSSCRSPASHGAGGGGFCSGHFAGCLLVGAYPLPLCCTLRDACPASCAAAAGLRFVSLALRASLPLVPARIQRGHGAATAHSAASNVVGCHAPGSLSFPPPSRLRPVATRAAAMLQQRLAMWFPATWRSSPLPAAALMPPLRGQSSSRRV